MTEPAHRMGDDQLWDAQDVARFLKVSRSWVYHRAESGELPCLRIGGLLRFDPGAIRAYARGAGADGERPSPALLNTPRMLRPPRAG